MYINYNTYIQILCVHVLNCYITSLLVKWKLKVLGYDFLNFYLSKQLVNKGCSHECLFLNSS